MSTSFDDPQRRTVPRWRLWRDAVRLGDADGAHVLRVPQKPKPEDLARAKFDWESHRSLPFAGDFVGKAYVLGQGDVAKDAAEFILKTLPETRHVVHDLAALILAEKTPGNQVVSEPPLRNAGESRRLIHRLR